MGQRHVWTLFFGFHFSIFFLFTFQTTIHFCDFKVILLRDKSHNC